MHLSLTKRYVFFLAAVICTLLTVSYFVTESMMRDGLGDLFRKRLDRGKAVLDQYARVDFLSRRTELETLLSSPRFVAAVATGDEATIRNEAPAYQTLSGADVFLITDPDHEVLYSGAASPSLIDGTLSQVDRNTENISPAFLLDGDDLIEMLSGPIVTADGFLIGHLVLGHHVQSYMPQELQQLTGFDVIVTHSGHMVGSTASPLIARLSRNQTLVASLTGVLNQTQEITLEDDQILFHSIPHHNAFVTFIAPLESHIAPILNNISSVLALVACIGGLAAIGAVWFFTDRRIGRQVDLLVGAAQRMATDDFDFKIVPASRDELGFLAREFERARERIFANRTELEEAHEARVKSERLAAIGSLTAGIVHDIKNPMAVIRGTADLIRHRSAGDETILRKCETIQNQIERVNELTRDLLEYSRGRTNLELQPITLNAYFEEIARQHHDAYERSGITLRYGGPDNVTARIDPTRFRRVIDNLVNNAREALRPGDEVNVSWMLTSSNLEVVVTDSGPGIPADILHTIFDPFVTKGKESGTGLGLAIARKITEDHGGTITVANGPDGGAGFTIKLPATIATASPGGRLSTMGVTT